MCEKSSNLDKLIAGNRKWVEETLNKDSEFFNTISKGQSPEYLWIGCSDSRVPASQVCGLGPGQAFVHRNIANVVSVNDLNILSVLQYSIEVLKVKKVLVCGHYSCGGVETAVKEMKVGLIDNWLTSIKAVKDENANFIKETLAHITDNNEYQQKQLDMMCELNALHQAMNLTKTTVVRNAWENGLEFTVHPIIFGLKDGQINEVGSSISSVEEATKVYNEAKAKIQKKYSK